MTEIYTKYSTKDLVHKRSRHRHDLRRFGGRYRAAEEDLIASYVDANLIAAIAAEHRKGRRLFIGTTNLDADRPVMWNIGAIANSTDPTGAGAHP